MERIVKTIASFFGLGYIPKLPGTATSLVVAVLYGYFTPAFLARLVLFGVFTVLGFLVCGKAEEIYREKDSIKITIDEASGMTLALLFFEPTLPTVITLFALFRFFDILKPFKIKELQKLPGSLGVMLDDLAAGITAVVISYPIITYLF